MAPHPGQRPRPILTLTQIRPFGSWRLRLKLWVSRTIPALTPIDSLGTIYSIRWSVLTRLPGAGRLPYPLLLWENNFAGSTEPYIEAFARRLGRHMNGTWGSSYGYPGSSAIGPLTSYLESMSYPAAHYYCAYPEATVRMIQSALAVEREDRFLAEAARTASPDEFAVFYRGFLTRRQGDL